MRGIQESTKAEICLNSLFQVQQRFWPLNFFISVRNEEPGHSLLQVSTHPSGVLDLAQLLEKLYQRDHLLAVTVTVSGCRVAHILRSMFPCQEREVGVSLLPEGSGSPTCLPGCEGALRSRVPLWQPISCFEPWDFIHLLRLGVRVVLRKV